MTAKRKRASALDDTKLIGIDAVQPSSRDASDEDVKDPVLEHVRETRANGNGIGNAGGDTLPGGSGTPHQHPAKRAKAGGSGAAAATGPGSAKGDENGLSADDTEAWRVGMAPPPQAGKVDPVGYKTNPPPQGRPVRVYADGVFDLFHLGHMRQLQQAKTAFPDVHLIVGVTGDRETHKRKGLTVLSGKERADSVRHCRWVDEVVEDCPWIINVDFLEKHGIDYVAHDDIPYGASEGDDIYAPIKREGKFLVTQRTEGLSTTGIITKIVRDYDQYIDRQLKRGTPRRELNVSWLKKNELDMKRNLSELRQNIKTNWTSAGQELGRELYKFWVGAAGGGSRPASPAPGVRAFDFSSAAVQNRIAAAAAGGGASSSSAAGDTPVVSPGAALGRLHQLDIPSPGGGASSSASGRGPSSDFAAGYSLGLLGGVRSWMSKSKRTLSVDDDGIVDGGKGMDSPGSGGSSDAGGKSPGAEGEEEEDDEGRTRKRRRGSG